MDYINPYNFVPLKEKPDRSLGFPGLHRLREDSFSGKLFCILTAETDLISLGEFKMINVQAEKPDGSLTSKEIKEYSFSKNGANQAILRGTTVKGMIRAIYECIEPSCLPLVALSGEYAQPVKKIPDVKTPTYTYSYQEIDGFSQSDCSNPEELCPGCRMFGNLAGAESLKGRLSFSDAVLCEKGRMRHQKVQVLAEGRFYLPMLDKPKPHHSQTYGRSLSDGGPMAGRKFYYHHRKTKNWRVEELVAAKRPHVYAVREYAPRDSEFEFSIICEDLSGRELGALVVALELEAGLAHKVGLGKAIGLGSCSIIIDWERSTVANSLSRYRNSSKGKSMVELTNEYKSEIKIIDELKEILRVDKDLSQHPISYPSFSQYKEDPFNKTIDAHGVFGGNTATVEGKYTAEQVTMEGPTEPMPNVGGGQEVAWLKEVYRDWLVFIHPDGKEDKRPRGGFQGKAEKLVPGRWYILFGDKRTASKLAQ